MTEQRTESPSYEDSGFHKTESQAIMEAFTHSGILSMRMLEG